MISRIDIPKLQFDTLSNNWVAINGVERLFNKEKQKANFFDTMYIDYLSFLPKDLMEKQRKVQEMNLDELEDLINTQERTGNDPSSTLVEYHSRYAFAFTSLIVVLFGLPISANKRKGGIAVQIGISILVTFVYMVFMKVSQAFGKNGALDPLITAWSANVFFLLAAVVSVFKLRR